MIIFVLFLLFALRMSLKRLGDRFERLQGMQSEFLSRIKEYRVTKDPSVLPEVHEADQLDDELEDIARALSDTDSEESPPSDSSESFSDTSSENVSKDSRKGGEKIPKSLPPANSEITPEGQEPTQERLEDLIVEKSQPSITTEPEEPHSPPRRDSLDSETSPTSRRRKRLDTFVVVSDAVSAVAKPPTVTEQFPSFGDVMKRMVEETQLGEAEIESSAPETFDEPPPTYRTNDPVVDNLTYISPTPPGSPPRKIDEEKPVVNLAEFLTPKTTIAETYSSVVLVPKTVIESPTRDTIPSIVYSPKTVIESPTKLSFPSIVSNPKTVFEPQVKESLHSVVSNAKTVLEAPTKTSFPSVVKQEVFSLAPEIPPTATTGIVFGDNRKSSPRKTEQTFNSPQVYKPRSPGEPSRELSPLGRTNERRKSVGPDPGKYWRRIRAEREGVNAILEKIAQIESINERIRNDFRDVKVRPAGITGEYLFKRRGSPLTPPPPMVVETSNSPPDERTPTPPASAPERQPRTPTPPADVKSVTRTPEKQVTPEKSTGIQAVISAWIPALATPQETEPTPTDQEFVPSDKIFGIPISPTLSLETKTVEIKSLGKQAWAILVIQKWFRKWRTLRNEKLASLASMAEVEAVAARETLRRRRRERRGDTRRDAYSVTPPRVMDDSLEGEPVEVVE